MNENPAGPEHQPKRIRKSRISQRHWALFFYGLPALLRQTRSTEIVHQLGQSPLSLAHNSKEGFMLVHSGSLCSMSARSLPLELPGNASGCGHYARF